MIDLGLVAGEASGDLLGAHFVDALKHTHPDLRAAGIAGPKLIQAGVEAVRSLAYRRSHPVRAWERG